MVRLFVLGAVETRDRHGYDIVNLAERWSIHRWTGISIGSIYSALRSLLKDGLVAVAKVERDGNRPERQLYSVTPAGIGLFQRLLLDGLASLDLEGRDVDVALAFAHRAPMEERKRAISSRLPFIKERLNQLEALASSYRLALDSNDPALSHFRELRESSPWIYAGVLHGLQRARVEEAWTEHLITEIDNWPIQLRTPSTSKS